MTRKTVRQKLKACFKVPSSWYIWKGLRLSYGTPRIDLGCVLWGESPVPFILVVQKNNNNLLRIYLLKLTT